MFIDVSKFEKVLKIVEGGVRDSWLITVRCGGYAANVFP